MNRHRKILVAGLSAAIIAGGGAAAMAVPDGDATPGHVPSQVQSALRIATERSGDSWSYAGTVSEHRQCWQLTSRNGESALFACTDGLWLGHYESVALTRLP